jgi:hypothetical protein
LHQHGGQAIRVHEIEIEKRLTAASYLSKYS